MAYQELDGFKLAAQQNLGYADLEQQRLAQLSQREQFYDSLRFQQEQADFAKRQAEKEAYAKWEKDQIMNQVAADLFKDPRGQATGVTDAKGNMVYKETPLSQAEQYIAAAKEAARRGNGAAASEFMAKGQAAQQAQLKAQQDAEQTRLENEKLKAETQLQLRKAEAGYRDGSDVAESTNAQGDVRLIDKRTGEVFKTITGAGKPSATFEKTQGDRKKTADNLDFAISELEKATAKGGLIEKSTGSGAGALIDKGAAFFGHATEGAVAAAALAPIYDLALKMVPRFEGPQSDKDTQSYREAAGQLSNPTIPNDQKMEAAKVILDLMKQKKGAFINANIEGGAEAPNMGKTSKGTEYKIIGE